MIDDDLTRFAESGAAPLPAAGSQGYVDFASARIWYGSYGSGEPVVFLHGSYDNSEDFGYQVAAALEAGYRAILIDSRGRGRSSRGSELFSYELMASEVLAVLDALEIPKAAIVGWSDGAAIGLILAMRDPSRVTRVFAFACAMDPSGLKEFVFTELVGRVFSRAQSDYARLSPTPGEFEALSAALDVMKDEPNYSAERLATIGVPVAIVASEHDEFIEAEHSGYLAHTIPRAELVTLPGVSHFALLQRPSEFDRAMLAFLGPSAA